MAECIRFDYPLPEDDRIHRIWNQISAIRHEVYADELQQYDSNPDGKIEDPGRHFIATVEGDDLVGYISLNPPGGRPFRLTTCSTVRCLLVATTLPRPRLRCGG